ncbi:Subtilase [Trema orientale]|uniref:Subtilase n=1 Tax=Trema orientale TaxID=63057 RepID=A0A2P5FZ08_TREOI|nr:Subtilase [Trema orientale]
MHGWSGGLYKQIMHEPFPAPNPIKAPIFKIKFKNMGRLTTRVRLLPKAFFLIAVWFWLAILVTKISSSSEIRSTYVVHMDKSLMPYPFASHKQWYSTIVGAIKSSSTPSIIHTYDHAMHGFSASLTKDELESLKKTPGFLLASDEKTCVLDTTHTPEFISLNSFNGLWPASDFGQDIIIGVVDSGIWPESESFKDDHISRVVPPKWNGTCDKAGDDFPSSLCNHKLIGARYFNSGFIAANPNVTVPGINSTRDTIGHGTATASVAAGNFVGCASYFSYAKGTAKGTAPYSRIVAYKVAWGANNSVAYSSDVLAGIDQAIADGVDVLLVPIGCDNLKIYEDPILVGSFAATKNGIVVSTSAGNEGTPTNNTIHNAIPWAITVAAGTVDRWFAGTVTLGNGETFTGWTLYPIKALKRNSPLVYSTTLSACNSSALFTNVTAGTVVVCDNTWPIRDQIWSVNAASDRVGGAIFITNDSNIQEKDYGKFPFPAVVINSSSRFSQDLIKYASNSSNNPSVTIRFQRTLLNTAPAPAATSFTSRGPSPYYPRVLKPDILAPGSQVLAAWPENLPVAQIGSINLPLYNDFNLLSGTSIAAAHVAGVTALLKAVYPEWSPAAIRSAVMTTADPRDNTGSPIRDNGIGSGSEPASPLALGSGQINANRALDPGLVYDIGTQDYINLLCSLEELNRTQIETIVGGGYNCYHFVDLNYPSFILLHRGDESNVTQKIFDRTVTNVGPASATYKATVTVPQELSVTVNPDTLEFSEQGENITFRVDVTFNRDNEDVVFGELVWVEQNGTRTVRSPIVTAQDVSPRTRRKPVLPPAEWRATL